MRVSMRVRMSVRMRVQEHVVKGHAVKGRAVPYDPLLNGRAVKPLLRHAVKPLLGNRNIFLNRQSKIEAGLRGFAVGRGRERRKRFLIGDIQR